MSYNYLVNSYNKSTNSASNSKGNAHDSNNFTRILALRSGRGRCAPVRYIYRTAGVLASTAKFDDPLLSLLAPHHDLSLLVPPKHSQTSFNDPPRGRALKLRAPLASGPSSGTHIDAIVAVDIRFIVVGENVGDAEVSGAGGRRGSEGQRFKEELGGVVAVLLHMDTHSPGEINAVRKLTECAN